ncbi:MAG: ATP-dependent sacrificial sulfur transferase LarE [Acidaminococcaceae bacterium]
MTKQLKEKYADLKRYLQGFDSLAVAFSGGVDSTFLLAAAKEVLGEKVTAITLLSGFVPESEVKEATLFAAALGVKHEFIRVDELDIPGVAENPPDRCYFCKKALFKKIKSLAEKAEIQQVVDGSNLDDEGDYRPGMHALAELGIKSPLRIAQLTKGEIRALSRMLNLPSWDKPSFACLASRIPYGEPITKEKLIMIETAEMFLMKQGFKQMRVRCHDKLARIEVPEADIPLFLNSAMREKIAEAFAKIGFIYTAIDIKGYRTGSLNEILKQ